MTKEPTSVRLVEKNFQPTGKGRARVNLKYEVDKIGETGAILRVEYLSAHDRTLISEKQISQDGLVEVSGEITLRDHYNGRIRTVLMGMAHPTAVEDDLGTTHQAPLSEGLVHFLKKNEVRRTPPPSESPSKLPRPQESSRILIAPLPSNPLATLSQKQTRGFDRKKTKLQIPDWVEKFVKIAAPAMAVFGTGLIAGVGAAGKFYYEGVKTGTEEAAEVQKDTKLASAIPLLVNEASGYQPVDYLPPNDFLGDDIQRWKKEQTADESHFTWRNKPVTLEEIKEGGSLYITRQALVWSEDRGFEKDKWRTNIYGIIAGIIKGRGASNMTDELCGAFWDYSGKYPPRDSFKGLARYSLGRINRKKHEYFCSVGTGKLGIDMSKEEVMKEYMTYVHFGAGGDGVLNLLERYWDITDLDDPRLTKGIKIVIGALPPTPFSSVGTKNKTKDQLIADLNASIERKWEGELQGDGTKKDGILPRALAVLDGLIKEGAIDPQEGPDIEREIRAAKPHGETVYQSMQKDKDGIFGYVDLIAKVELKNHLKSEHVDFDTWKLSSDGLVVGLNEDLQVGVTDSMTNGLKKQVPNVVGTTFVVNQDGVFLAVNTGTANGYDMPGTLDRVTRTDNPASTGKLYIGAEASINHTPEDPIAQQAAYDLSHSLRALATAARQLSIDPQTIQQRIQCYGHWREKVNPNKIDGIEAAVTGNWDVKPGGEAAMLYAMMTGRTLPSPHLIIGDESDGHLNAWQIPSDYPSATCAQSMYENGKALSWGRLPFRHGGTMDLMGPSIGNDTAIGKTGTAEAVNAVTQGIIPNTTNIVWGPFAVKINGETYIVVDYMRPEMRRPGVDHNNNPIVVQAQDFGANMGDKLISTGSIVPVSNDVLKAIKKDVSVK